MRRALRRRRSQRVPAGLGMPGDAPIRFGRGRATPAPDRRGVRVAVAAASLLLAAALGGCASARNELGTADSNCYIGLPEGVAAVHHHGHLFGVRLLSVASLERGAPVLYRAARHAPGKKVGQVCLVAFTGSFDAATVEHPLTRSGGHLAVVELGYPSKRLLGTLLLRRTPLPFAHTHL